MWRTYSFGPRKPTANEPTSSRTLWLGSISDFAVSSSAVAGTATVRMALAPYSILSALGPRKPARISRRNITVESLGAEGTSDPSLLTRSRHARLGWDTGDDASTAAAVTRSIAALGRTQSWSPRVARMPTIRTKISTVAN